MAEQTNITTNITPGFLNNLQFLNFLRQTVTNAGGEWCGIQESLFPDLPLLRFTSRETGSTLAVPFNPISCDGSELFNAVLAKIAESNQKFIDRPVTIKASRLKEIAVALLKLQEEITALYARSEKCPSPSKKS